MLNKERKKSNKQIAEDGLAEMEKWMREIGIVMNISEFGVKSSDISICYGSFYAYLLPTLKKDELWRFVLCFVIFANTHNTVM